jgi:Flp pilus assembly protein TadG
MIPPKGQIRRARQALQGIAGALRRFGQRDEGNVTVEFVLWVPVLCAVLMLFVDTSLAYMSQSNFWNISRETARIVSRHAFDASAAEAYARSRITLGDYEPDVQVSINGHAVTVTISALSSAVTPFGILDFALDQRISASVTNVMEPI